MIHNARETAEMNLCKNKLECLKREATLTHPSLDPWEWETEGINFKTCLDYCSGKNDSPENINKAAERLYKTFGPLDIICYTDGSVREGTDEGGGGAVITIPEVEEKITLTRACGAICSSFRAEMMAIEAALKYINKHLEKCEIEFDRTLCVVDAYRLSVGYHIPKRRSQRPTYYSWR